MCFFSIPPASIIFWQFYIFLTKSHKVTEKKYTCQKNFYSFSFISQKMGRKRVARFRFQEVQKGSEGFRRVQRVSGFKFQISRGVGDRER